MERRLATVLFVDLVDSTQYVSATDPEIVRRRVNRFFEQVSHCVTAHGGTVEKFAGDAVMAAFGIPRSHEDDAERAVRAALGILDSVRELGLEARVGVEAGEVVSDETDSTFATGEPVNLAARLQQIAKAGEILMGPGARRLTLGRVQADDVGPSELRGFAQPVWVWRVTGASRNGHGPQRVSAPLIGRDAELDLLANTYERAVRDRSAHLFTVYGEPGVGKSRLAREFVASIEGATVLAGRTLPYGEGITYWPLAEMVKASAGIADDDPLDVALEKLRACCEDEAIADLLALASGVLQAVESERGQQEISWAARAWAAKLAEPQPLVLVIEDIHWAEEPMLDLIEHLAEWVRDAPLLVLCLARPELLEVRPGWSGGRVRAAAIELAPLARDASGALADALLEKADLPPDLRDSLLAKTEGNPLFLEETVRMLVEQESGASFRTAAGIPDTLQTLIAARIDRLPLGEKTVLRRAAVMGRVFWAGALAHIAPDIEEREDMFADLLAREFVLPEQRSSIPGEAAYRFKHVLIREVAYAGLAKSARAELHARFAEWLRDRAGDELLEIRAFHLDQAAALHAELDGAPPAALATEAAAALEAAGRRALSREAFTTARKLLRRAVELDATLERRFFAARAAWRLGDFELTAAEMEEVRLAAEAVGERKIHGRALTALAEIALYHLVDAQRARELSDRALDVLEDVTHPDARFEALGARGLIASFVGDQDVVERVGREALAVAREAGREDLESLVTYALAQNAIVRHDLPEAERLAERSHQLATSSGSLQARAQALFARSWVDSAYERLDEAQAALDEAKRLFEEIGSAAGIAQASLNLGRLALQAGQLDDAERSFREAVRGFKTLGDRGHLCEAQRGLAQVLAGLGRLDEAEKAALDARASVGPEDRFSASSTTMALGVVRAAQGRDAEAEELLREALAGFEPSPYRHGEREALAALTIFLRERGRDDDAVSYEERTAALTPSAAPIA